jgi:hypothetical protein
MVEEEALHADFDKCFFKGVVFCHLCRKWFKSYKAFFRHLVIHEPSDDEPQKRITFTVLYMKYVTTSIVIQNPKYIEKRYTLMKYVKEGGLDG